MENTVSYYETVLEKIDTIIENIDKTPPELRIPDTEECRARYCEIGFDTMMDKYARKVHVPDAEELRGREALLWALDAAVAMDWTNPAPVPVRIDREIYNEVTGLAD